ncbi:hypothetical protein PO909_002089 [Leuciscus waleckii]
MFCRTVRQKQQSQAVRLHAGVERKECKKSEPARERKRGGTDQWRWRKALMRRAVLMMPPVCPPRAQGPRPRPGGRIRRRRSRRPKSLSTASPSLCPCLRRSSSFSSPMNGATATISGPIRGTLRGPRCQGSRCCCRNS